MCTYIAMEDLAANALIELLEKNNCRKVSFTNLMNYGFKIVKYYCNNNEDATLLVTRDYVSELFINYSDFFTVEKSSDDEEFIVLREGKTSKDLRDHFRAYLTLNELLAFIDKEALQELGVAA